MYFKEYRKDVEAISWGKRVGPAIYVFRTADVTFGPALDPLLQRLILTYQITSEHNVLKFRVDEFKISFLSYPEFMDEPHPGLRHAVTIDLITGKARQTDYRHNLNPPILHRKEAFLPPDHPKRAEFAALTEAEENNGLFEHTSTIGFKLNWDRLLASKSLKIENGQLHSIPSPSPPRLQSIPFIQRHKTAITRYELSKPVKTLLEYELLAAGHSFFDYGCGQGSDVRGLQALGYPADGWDPVFQPEIARKEADVVNLGYVLNVIEDPAERLEALIDAFRYTKGLLVVSALINHSVETDHCPKFRDGVLTARNTFQKYFEQQELQQYIEDALETTAVPVALGIFYVFRDPADQQDFLSARSRRIIDWSQITARLGLGAPSGSRWKTLYKEHQELLDQFATAALALGRFPETAEFSRSQEICEVFGSPKRALRAFVFGSDGHGMDWSDVAKRFGIGQSPKPRWEILYEQNKELLDAFYQELLRRGRLPDPEEFARSKEITNTIGSAKKALRLFIRRGGSETLKQAAENRRNDLLVYVALANLRKRVPFGHLSTSLRFDIKEFFGNYKTALEKGLFGAVEQSDIIKIHKSSGKVTFLVYDNFETNPPPLTTTRNHNFCPFFVDGMPFKANNLRAFR
jgi:hypothetical protein